MAEVGDGPEAPNEPAPATAAAHSASTVDAPAADPADEPLVRRVADGDQTALGELYDRYGRPAYSLARRICADDGIAEDVVQEVFLAFWRDPMRFDPQRGAFGTWLLTLVHHKSVDAVRRESAIRRRTVPAAEDGEEWSAPPGPGRRPGRARRRRGRSGPRRAGAAAGRATPGAGPGLLRRLHPTRGRHHHWSTTRHGQVPHVHRGTATYAASSVH